MLFNQSTPTTEELDPETFTGTLEESSQNEIFY